MAENKKTLANAIESILENGCSVERKQIHLSKTNVGYMMLAFNIDSDIKSEKVFALEEKDKAISTFMTKSKLSEAAEGK